MIITVYHITPKSNRQSILREGLIPKPSTGKRIHYGPRIFVSRSENELAFDYVNFENVDCWAFKVNAQFLKNDEFTSSKNFCYIEHKIEPADLKLHSSY